MCPRSALASHGDLHGVPGVGPVWVLAQATLSGLLVELAEESLDAAVSYLAGGS